MKHIFMSIFLFAGITFAYSQVSGAGGGVPRNATTENADPAWEAARPLETKYGLNSDQTKKMRTIQARKLRNLAEIEVYKTGNPALYRAKLESIQKGTQNSIRRMLNTKEQQTIFQKTMAEQRRLRQAKREELSAQGASKEVVDAAVLDIYLE